MKNKKILFILLAILVLIVIILFIYKSSAYQVGQIGILNLNSSNAVIQTNQCDGSSADVCTAYINFTANHPILASDLFNLSNSSDSYQVFRWENNSWLSYYYTGSQSANLPQGENNIMIIVWKSKVTNAKWEIIR
jgi:hypothetical protein